MKIKLVTMRGNTWRALGLTLPDELGLIHSGAHPPASPAAWATVPANTRPRGSLRTRAGSAPLSPRLTRSVCETHLPGAGQAQRLSQRLLQDPSLPFCDPSPDPTCLSRRLSFWPPVPLQAEAPGGPPHTEGSPVAQRSPATVCAPRDPLLRGRVGSPNRREAAGGGRRLRRPALAVRPGRVTAPP